MRARGLVRRGRGRRGPRPCPNGAKRASAALRVADTYPRLLEPNPCAAAVPLPHAPIDHGELTIRERGRRAHRMAQHVVRCHMLCRTPGARVLCRRLHQTSAWRGAAKESLSPPAPNLGTARRGERGAASERVRRVAASVDALLTPPATREHMLERIAADEAALARRWEISLPDTAWDAVLGRDELLSSWGNFFARRGLVPASLAPGDEAGAGAGSAGNHVVREDERRLLTLLTAAYSGPLTVAKALHELVQPEVGADAADSAANGGAAADVPAAGARKKLFRARSGQSNRKGMPHHQIVAARPAPPPPARRPVEIHVLGPASQEETLLATYWPELGLLFPDLSLRVSLIGPELSTRTIFSKNLALADNMTAHFFREDYASWRHAHAGKKAYRPPDLLVAFNPGFGTDCDEWRRTLELLREGAAPLVSTCFDVADAEKDLSLLRQVGWNVAAGKEGAERGGGRGVRINEFGSQLLERSRDEQDRIIRCNAKYIVSRPAE